MKNIRWYGYWLTDFFRGSPVRKYYNEVKREYSEGTSKTSTQKKIRKLVDHAIRTTAFYEGFDEGIDFLDLPIMNKNIYNENYDQFLSETYRNAKNNRVMYTSGSTGTPFAMVQNKNKINHNTAASIFLCSIMNYDVGLRQGFLRVWVDANRKTRFQEFVENIYMIDVTHLDDEGIRQILDFIRKRKINVLLGYASTFVELSKYLASHPYVINKVKIQSIISTSEMLPESVRDNLREIFSCDVQSMYSNEENGIMAVQSPDEIEYYVDSSSYDYEFLKLDSDLPADEGEISRIVITDLYNYAFPILRYDTGDTAVYWREICGGNYKVYLKELFGRKTDVLFDSQGRQISPHAVTNYMWGVAGIRQWQFVQVGEVKYEVVINLLEAEIDEIDVINRLKNILGSEAQIIIRYVNEIPVLKSGKRRYIVNEYRN
jgi:phenylacetate-CoA ligase